jgi:hypothetical protein
MKTDSDNQAYLNLGFKSILEHLTEIPTPDEA